MKTEQNWDPQQRGSILWPTLLPGGNFQSVAWEWEPKLNPAVCLQRKRGREKLLCSTKSPWDVESILLCAYKRPRKTPRKHFPRLCRAHTPHSGEVSYLWCIRGEFLDKSCLNSGTDWTRERKGCLDRHYQNTTENHEWINSSYVTQLHA
jgi:hypothetical protein